MGRFQGAGMHRAKWALVAAGLLSTSCAGVVGLGAAVVVVGAGVVGFTCYDRVSVTVIDRLTGTNLCDAKVAFVKGKSETVATSCYQAALSAGSYTLRVERHGLETFEEPVVVSDSGECGQTIQTMYVALDRKNRVAPPQQIAPAPAPLTPPPAVAAPPAASPPVTTPPVTTPGAVAPPAATPGAVAPPTTAPGAATPPAVAPPAVPPSVVPPPAAAPRAAPAPATTAFPDAPK